MKIYAVADIHGKTERFDLIREMAVTVEADCIVMAGDIAGCLTQKRSAAQIAKMPLPVLAVRGNSDRCAPEKTIWPTVSISSLHLRKIDVGGVCFSGISGTCLLPFESRLRFRENRFYARVGSFFEDVAVMVAHPPPRGVQDKVFGQFHAGSSILRQIVLTCQPEILICGHIHEQAGAAHLEQTLVVNCSIGRIGKGALVNYQPGSPPSVDFL